MGYTLVDPPVTPFSPADEIAAWVARCRAEVEARPDDLGWRHALAEAEALMLAAADEHGQDEDGG